MAGAVSLLESSGYGRGAERCPHPKSLEGNAILVRGNHRDMVMCAPCLRLFQGLSVAYRERRIGPHDVVTQMLASGYTRRDAARFVLELIAERLRVPLGFRRLLP